MGHRVIVEEDTNPVVSVAVNRRPYYKPVARDSVLYAASGPDGSHRGAVMPRLDVAVLRCCLVAPVVGEPGVHVSYIWVYLCKKPEWEKI